MVHLAPHCLCQRSSTARAENYLMTVVLLMVIDGSDHCQFFYLCTRVMLMLMTIIVNWAMVNIHMLLCNDFAKGDSTVKAEHVDFHRAGGQAGGQGENDNDDSRGLSFSLSCFSSTLPRSQHSSG